jgi:hypothetical protein
LMDTEASPAMDWSASRPWPYSSSRDAIVRRPE